jgi:hypothetical protein
MAKAPNPVPPEAQHRSHYDVAKDLGTVEERPTHEEIAQRAYEIFHARGGKPGDSNDDWHRAEHELMQERKGKK